MRSSNTLQNTQSNLNTPKDKSISSLASQFMDMFDASKLEASLLKKREFQSQDNLYQKELQKKIKTSMTNTSLTRPSLIQMPNLNPLLYNSFNSQINPLLAALGQDPSFGLQAEMGRVSQLQNLLLLQQQKEALKALQPLAFPSIGNFHPQSLSSNKDKLCVKEEYVAQEEPTAQGTPSSVPNKSNLGDNRAHNERLSENSPVNTELQMPGLEVDEPALVGFTREFPDWDLATIFGYIKSGKSRQAFEKEKQFKMERKLKKQKLRVAKNGNKGKKIAQKAQEEDF